MDDGHHIKQFTAPHGVVHDVHLRSQPCGDVLRPEFFRQLRLGHECAVGEVAGAAWRAVAQQSPAQAAPQAVRADEQIAFDLQAITSVHCHSLRTLLKGFDCIAVMQTRLSVLYCPQHQRMQVGPVRRQIRRTITCGH